MVEARQQCVIDDEGQRQDGEYCGPGGDDAADAIAVEDGLDHHDDPQPDKKPQRVTPHGDGAASARRGKRDRRYSGAKREKGHDAAVEGVGGIIAVRF